MSALHIFLDAEECRPPDQRAIDWLLAQGVSIESIASPWAIHCSRVVFQPSGRYMANPLGTFAFILAVIGATEIADAVAWSPTTGRIGTRLGIGACLGEGQIGRNEIGTTGRALPVWRTPLAWLQADRCGVVVVDVDLARHRLAGLALQAEDENHRRHLRKTLRLQPPTIVVPALRRAA